MINNNGKEGSNLENPKIHKIAIAKFYEELKTSKNGLTKSQVESKQKQYGKNKLSEKKTTPEIIKFLLQFKSFFSILLLIGSTLSFVSDRLVPGEGSNYIGWVLLGVTVFNAIFTYIQERKAEQAMKSFKNLITTKVTVIRDGKEIEINSEDIVPGDLFWLREGDKISADARIIECYNLKVDHSALTGESEPQLRSTTATNPKAILSRNMVFSGTLVQNGSGKAVVVATGDRTEIGRIAKLTTEVVVKQSHMQRELAHFIKIISIIAIILGIGFFFAGFFMKYNATGNIETALLLNLVFAIGIIVANVPEGLLPTVTLTLSIAAQKMAKKNALVKNMDSIETLGSLTTICSDKTGTLTENVLKVRCFWINGKMYYFNSETESISMDGKEVHIEHMPGAAHMKDALINCNNSSYDTKTEKSSGDPTEICLKQFISTFSNIDYLQSKMPRVFEVPFESAKKYMITANESGDAKHAYLKGAPEVVLRKCTSISSNRKKSKLTKKEIKQIQIVNDEYSSKGYRVLAFATKNITKLKKLTEKSLEEPDYTFYGLIIMQDPPRPEVKDAVAQCQTAGIRIVVISGDQGNTVKSIAHQVGIVKDNNVKVVLSSDLNKMSDEELQKVLDHPQLIFARSLPEDKLRIVENLQAKGEIVAVTGDGVNDAPALKRADVGIAMGRGGTEVAKEAADIVLIDDNFATITHAIKFGRTVYNNIQSFITYILTSNTPEIVPFILFVLFAGWNFPLALPVLLILAIDLGTDMLPAIGLGVEKPSDDIMHRPPRIRDEKLCNIKMFVQSYGLFGPVQTLFAYIVFFNILYNGGWSLSDPALAFNSPLYMSAVSGFFTTIIVVQIFNLFACRSSRVSFFKTNFFSNKVILLGICSEIILVLILIFFDPVSKIFGTTSFNILYVPYMIAGGILLLTFEEIRKYLERKYGLFRVR